MNKKKQRSKQPLTEDFSAQTGNKSHSKMSTHSLTAFFWSGGVALSRLDRMLRAQGSYLPVERLKKTALPARWRRSIERFERD